MYQGVFEKQEEFKEKYQIQLDREMKGMIKVPSIIKIASKKPGNVVSDSSLVRPPCHYFCKLRQVFMTKLYICDIVLPL